MRTSSGSSFPSRWRLVPPDSVVRLPSAPRGRSHGAQGKIDHEAFRREQTEQTGSAPRITQHVEARHGGPGRIELPGHLAQILTPVPGLHPGDRPQVMANLSDREMVLDLGPRPAADAFPQMVEDLEMH